MILNLGCGSCPLPGAVNHDRRRHAPWVDVVHDLDVYSWPWANNSFDRIQAIDVLEHLSDWVRFWDECHRILRPDGQVEVRVPRHDSPNVHLDPTHKRGYCTENFDFLDPETEWGRKATIYSPHSWRKVRVLEDGDNISATMAARK